MNIGFDLDQIFISYPPIAPSKFIDWLYRNHCTPKLSYRIPDNRLEQYLRKTTHFSYLRPKIKKNIDFLLNLPHSTHTFNLITSRYQFLEKLTHKILKKYHLYDQFSTINLNLKNEQPHLFKEQTIKKLGIELFVDDDLELLKHLSKTCPNTTLLWYNPKSKKVAPDGIITIRDLSEMAKFIK